MTSSMRRVERGTYEGAYGEKESFFNDRFYPGEFGVVIGLGVAALLLWAVALYGITTEPKGTGGAAANTQSMAR